MGIPRTGVDRPPSGGVHQIWSGRWPRQRLEGAGQPRGVPFEMVDEVLAEYGAVQRRLRKLPARVVVCLLLQLARMPRSEDTCSHRDLTCDDRLSGQRSLRSL